MKRSTFNKIRVLAAVALFILPGFAAGQAAPLSDAATQQAVISRLQEKKQFRDVSASVANYVVTLQGSVARLQDKIDLEKRVRKSAKADAIRDLVQISSTAPDKTLRAKLSEALAYDRVGYWNVFNVVELGVNHGVVTLAGEVRTPQDKASALALVARTPGVKGLVDELKVAPPSMFDDEIRIRTLRAIYSDPVLAKYAMDPQAPIRILVDHGKVGLYGTVDSAMDKQVAMMRASSVFGAFSVENHLVSDGGVAR